MTGSFFVSCSSCVMVPCVEGVSSVMDGRVAYQRSGGLFDPYQWWCCLQAIWAKGYTELLDLMEKDSASREMHTHVDCYGYGDDLEEVCTHTPTKAQNCLHVPASPCATIHSLHQRTEPWSESIACVSTLQLKAASARKKLPLQFHGARDHLDDSMHEYRVFVNPSTSDVVATTTAEALAMGKWVVVADLPCNVFFKRFSNCLTYRSAWLLTRTFISVAGPLSIWMHLAAGRCV